MTALLSAIIRSTKMKVTSKTATSNSREYKRGVIILTGNHPLVKLAKKIRETKAKENKNESRTTG